MTLFPPARWRGPVPNQGGRMGPIVGLVLHIQQGTEAGTDAWLHNPASKVSAHFGNPKSGPLDQWVEVGTVAWAEVNGNTNWISLENEGNSGDSLTASQLENAAQLLAWLHTGWNVPLQISDSTRPGLTGHGLGGAGWGGHYDCPGAPILAQRQAIIDRAAAILGGAPTTGVDMTPAETQMLAEIHQSAVAFANWQFFSPPGREQVQGTHAWRMQSTLDNTNAIAVKLDQLLARQAPPAVVDVQALASALHPLIQAGATADEVATAVVAHLAMTLAKG